MGGKPLATFWRLVASTGMRRSEACGLSWDDVDVDDGRPTVSVRRGLHPMKGGLYVSPPKSEEGTRTIGITERLAADLRDLRASTVGAVPFKVEGADEPLDFVFRWGKSLQPLNPDTATRWFGKEWDHARLRRGVTLHGLRHSHGSALIGLRLPDTQVAARLGHSPQVLRTIYARDLDEAERQDRMREVTTELYG
jgi:integrase